MFWDSVRVGLANALNVHVLYASAAYAFVATALTILSALLFDSKKTSTKLAGIGVYFLGGTAVQSLMISMTVFYLFPIMLGYNQPESLSVLIESWRLVLLIGAVGIAAGFFVGMIPVIGRITTNTPGVDSFVEGIVVCRVIVETNIGEALRKKIGAKDLFPGWIDLAGYLFITIAVSWFIMFIYGITKIYIMRKDEYSVSIADMALVPLLIRIVSIIPVFMYSGYIALGLKSLR